MVFDCDVNEANQESLFGLSKAFNIIVALAHQQAQLRFQHLEAGSHLQILDYKNLSYAEKTGVGNVSVELNARRTPSNQWLQLCAVLGI